MRGWRGTHSVRGEGTEGDVRQQVRDRVKVTRELCPVMVKTRLTRVYL